MSRPRFHVYNSHTSLAFSACSFTLPLAVYAGYMMDDNGVHIDSACPVRAADPSRLLCISTQYCIH